MHVMIQVSFRCWYLHGARDEETDITLVHFCAEAFFYASGYVNSQDKPYPPPENPMLTHKEPSHHVKASALSVHWITEPIFFPATIN